MLPIYGGDEDVEAWYLYPQYRLWSNKLYVAEQFNYRCGPAGIPVPFKDQYIVRPIMNLAGMGVGARIQQLTPEDSTKIPAGYFWCEMFEGEHLSIDYVKEDNQFKLLNCYRGFNSKKDLTRFTKWQRVDYNVTIPDKLKDLNVEKINVEMINHNVIEIHLRNGFGHMMEWKEIIPIFKNDPQRREGYRFVKGPASGYGSLLYPRIGYLVKGNDK